MALIQDQDGTASKMVTELMAKPDCRLIANVEIFPAPSVQIQIMAPDGKPLTLVKLEPQTIVATTEKNYIS
jgi:hypothetical protein